jgi:crotonobetainyl-CoA:carnitine CoA-transferase CaiB-like acyl-CoA transferase
MVAQAMAGVMSLTGEPGGRPVRCGIPIGDLAAGMFAAIGILAALVKRQRDGSGDYLDVAMLDSQISMLSYLGIYHLFAGIEPGPQGRGHYSIPTYRSFLAGDGREILITANSEKMWAGLCAALELPDLEHDPLYRTNAERLQNQASLISLLEARFAQRTSAEWLVRLAGHDVPAAPVNTVSEALADPQVAARDMVVSIHSPDGSTERLIGNPVKFASSESAAMRPAPRLGEQTQAVLHELLGYDEDRTRAVAGPH